MLSLSSKAERPDHVWKFKPLPTLPSGGLEGGGGDGELERDSPPAQAASNEGKKGSWFGGGS